MCKDFSKGEPLLGLLSSNEDASRDGAVGMAMIDLHTYYSEALRVRYYAFETHDHQYLGKVHVQGPVTGGMLDLHFSCEHRDWSPEDALARARLWAEHSYPLTSV